MGSDSSPQTLFDAVVEVSEKSEFLLSFVVFVAAESAEALLKSYALATSNRQKSLLIDFCFVQEFISMEDDPLSAVRIKKGASLSKGIQHLKEGKIDAFVTAGNTGALIAACAFYLSPIGEFDRPALLASFPTKEAPLTIVDVGGNVSARAQHLVQYAQIGAAYQRTVRGIELPRIGLLNIGAESSKGTPEIKQAFHILKELASVPESRIAFLGNTEAREIFNGEVDVLVTDGFTGNVLLKSSQGASSFVFEFLKESIIGKVKDETLETLSQLQRRFNYEEYPGAIVCGVEGIVIKCHGAATKKAMMASIEEAAFLAEHSFVKKIKSELRP